jgi:hypothetical protein
MLDTNPVTNPGSDGLGVFGKYSGKKKLSSKAVLDLMKQIGGQGEEEEPEDLSSFLSMSRPKAMMSTPAYDPNKFYGGMYGMYGGRRFRGGLLGE